MPKAMELDTVLSERVSEQAATAESSRRRLTWLDATRGLGIILVVLGHSLGGMIDADRIPSSDWFRPLFLLIYSFHMPLFFMLSGLFVAPRVERQKQGFLLTVLRSILWPALLWSVVQLTLIKLAGNAVNAPLTNYWQNLAWLPIAPVSQFWFLYALFLLHVVSVIVLPRVGPVGLILVAFGLSSLVSTNLFPAILFQTGAMAPFYAIGVWIGASGGLDKKVLDQPATLVFGLLVAAATAVGLSAHQFRSSLGNTFASMKAVQIAELTFTFPAVFAALLAALAIGLAMAHLRAHLGKLLPYLGRHSLTIYVLHVMFVAGCRIALTRFLKLSDPTVTLVIVVLVGLIGPMVVYEAARRGRLDKALGLT